MRVLAFLAPEPVPLALLLADKPTAGLLGPEVAAAIGPLLGDRVAAGDAITALRRYSLVGPAGTAWCWCTAWYRLSPVPSYSRRRRQVGTVRRGLVDAAVPADARLAADVADVRGAAAACPSCP